MKVRLLIEAAILSKKIYSPKSIGFNTFYYPNILKVIFVQLWALRASKYYYTSVKIVILNSRDTSCELRTMTKQSPRNDGSSTARCLHTTVQVTQITAESLHTFRIFSFSNSGFVDSHTVGGVVT
jgi:hypothetical protein